MAPSSASQRWGRLGSVPSMVKTFEARMLTHKYQLLIRREKQKHALLFPFQQRGQNYSLPLVLIAVSILAASVSGSKFVAGTTVGYVGSWAWGSKADQSEIKLMPSLHHVLYKSFHKLNRRYYPNVERELSQKLWYHSHRDGPGKGDTPVNTTLIIRSHCNPIPNLSEQHPMGCLFCLKMSSLEPTKELSSTQRQINWINVCSWFWSKRVKKERKKEIPVRLFTFHKVAVFLSFHCFAIFTVKWLNTTAEDLPGLWNSCSVWHIPNGKPTETHPGKSATVLKSAKTTEHIPMQENR